MDPLQRLATEGRNPLSHRLDELTAVEIVGLMNREDATVPAAVAAVARDVAQLVEVVADRLAKGGRLIYCGAGTSGRLGVLDAAECPPTFQTPPGQVVGLIAGGKGAMFQAVEGAEDSPELGEQDLRELNLTPTDVVVGIASSGRTPYVIGAVRYARRVGAFTAAVVCTPEAELSAEVDLTIAAVTGPEVLTGSTRLKAGTATKLVLNTVTTGAMVRLGKSFGNLMVDLRASNQKLVARAGRIVRTVTGLDAAAAADLLARCGGEVKTALVVHAAGVPADRAREALAAAGGRVAAALAGFGKPKRTDAAPVRPWRPDLVIGIDGGGTTTVCLLADRSGTVLGRGAAGPSNIQAVGVEAGLTALDEAIDRAFQAAGLDRSTVGGATLGLAGIDRQEGLDVINGWAGRVALADKVGVANDATLLLAAGTPAGWGLAVIAGTGSIAFVKTPDGQVGRCGGWGYTLGDEGSAYRLALTGLRAVCRAHDRVGPATALTDAFLNKMSVPAPPDLIPAVYRGPWDRSAIAGLAPLVLAAAEAGDVVAVDIVKSEATELARTAAGAAGNAGLAGPVPLALAGGVLLGSAAYRRFFLDALAAAGVVAEPVELVHEPARGAVKLAIG
jgi:N-acetylmuramic acid 6-phosphate etherase